MPLSAPAACDDRDSVRQGAGTVSAPNWPLIVKAPDLHLPFAPDREWSVHALANESAAVLIRQISRGLFRASHLDHLGSRGTERVTPSGSMESGNPIGLTSVPPIVSRAAPGRPSCLEWPARLCRHWSHRPNRR